MEYWALFTYLSFISYDLMALILLLGYNIDCVYLLEGSESKALYMLGKCSTTGL